MTGEAHPLSETDKKALPAADAGDTVSVTPGQEFPLAAGVDENRATRFAVFDKLMGEYVGGTVRLRPPTERMVRDLEARNADDGRDRFEWHRV